MIKLACLFAALLLAGCGNREVPATQPAVPAATNAAAEQAAPARESFGNAVVDVITERNKVEAGLKAKAQIQAVAAKENKEIEAVLNEK